MQRLRIRIPELRQLPRHRFADASRRPFSLIAAGELPADRAARRPVLVLEVRTVQQVQQEAGHLESTQDPNDPAQEVQARQAHQRKDQGEVAVSPVRTQPQAVYESVE